MTPKGTTWTRIELFDTISNSKPLLQIWVVEKKGADVTKRSRYQGKGCFRKYIKWNKHSAITYALNPSKTALSDSVAIPQPLAKRHPTPLETGAEADD